MLDEKYEMKPPAPFLARVFWPESVRVREDESALFATSGSGFIVGWNVSEFTCCVLSLVDSTELRVLLQTLERLANGEFQNVARMMLRKFNKLAK